MPSLESRQARRAAPRRIGRQDTLAQSLRELAAAMSAPPVVNVAAPVVNVAPPAVEVTVEAPQVSVEPRINVPAASVVYPQKTVETIERDPKTLEITRVVREIEQ